MEQEYLHPPSPSSPSHLAHLAPMPGDAEWILLGLSLTLGQSNQWDTASLLPGREVSAQHRAALGDAAGLGDAKETGKCGSLSYPQTPPFPSLLTPQLGEQAQVSPWLPSVDLLQEPGQAESHRV